MLGIGTCSTIINFNSGAVGFLNVTRKLCSRDGPFTRDYCLEIIGRKSTTAVENSRKRSRAIRKGFGDKGTEKGDVYLPGGF